MRLVILLVILLSNFCVLKVYASETSTAWTPLIKTTLTGDELKDGMFNYTISSKNGGPLPSNTTVTNSGEDVLFDAVTFDSSDVGKIYYYEISENEKSYYRATPASYEVSVRITRNSDNNIIALENILKNTNNPTANKLGSITWAVGGWGVRSTGDGTGSIHTIDDAPTYETTTFRIDDHTSGNRNWGQTINPYVIGNEYILSGYVRIPVCSIKCIKNKKVA